MLGFFTDPHDEELLFSACGRYHDRLQYGSYRDTMQDLFGIDTITAAADLPSNLAALVERLGPGHRYTVDSLIDQHTLLPFYSPFCPPERLQELREDMYGSRGGAIHNRAGIMASQVSQPEYLRYCPLCFEQDIDKRGEPFWHRSPQISGIMVCADHVVWLEDSSIPMQRDDIPYAFISAAAGIQPCEARTVDTQDKYDCLLMAFARDAQWLLQQPNLCEGLETVRLRYVSLLTEQGYATHSGRIHATRLLKAFKATYPDWFLEMLHCQLDEDVQEHWLCRLTRNRDAVFSPIQHLLLIHFLGHCAESFFSYTPQQRPFGDGPWACLNKVCPYFNHPRIKACKVTYDQADGRPVGAFHCDHCGFEYARKGPDRTEDDLRRIGRIVSFGQMWLDELQNLAEDATVSLREKARRLGVDPATVKHQLSKQNTAKGESMVNQQPVDAANVEQYKRLWLEARSKYPDFGTKQLRALIPAVYMFLYRHARAWLIKNAPATKRNSKPKAPRVDWHIRDVEIASQIPSILNNLRERTGRPRRITVATIGQSVGHLEVIQQHLDKLPLTSDLLAKYAESREQYALRRIAWAEQQFREEHHVPKLWELVKRSGVERLTSLSVVMQALLAAIENLRRWADGSEG